MKVCFVSNFEKTWIFLEVAKVLKDRFDIDSVWIVVNQSIKDKMVKRGVVEEDILFLPKNVKQHEQTVYKDLKFNELVYADRYLRYDMEAGQAYLEKVRDYAYFFLKKHKAKLVLGELTWAHERALYRLLLASPELSCRYLKPHVVRIPNGRFVFFQSEIEDLPYVDSQNLQLANYELVKLAKPLYYSHNNKKVAESQSLVSRLKRLKRFITGENIDKYDPTLLYHPKRRFKIGYTEEKNRLIYRFVKRTPASFLKGKSYLFYPLHKQPEASIDVLGQYYEDQYLNIVNIWRLLGPDMYLAVKEHPNAIGDRSEEFFKKVSALSRVVVVHEMEESWNIIENATGVFSVSSTASYEAALMGVESFTFSPIFFNKLKGCYHVTLNDLSTCRNFEDLLTKLRCRNQNQMDQDQFSRWLFYNSFQGKWSPTEQGVMDSSNIMKLANAIISILIPSE